MKKTNKEKNIVFNYDYLRSAASSHDCTGLIPVAPENDAALNSYGDFYPYLPATPADANPGDQMEDFLEMMTPEKYL